MLYHSEEFSRRLKEQSLDAESLADRLYSRAPTTLSTTGRAELRVARMSPELLKILSTVEASRRRVDEEIDGAALIHAWFVDGGGEMGEFLVECGVNLRRLLES